MKTILLFVLLFTSVAAAGQTDIKFVVRGGEKVSSDHVMVEPESYDLMVQEALQGKTPGEEGLVAGNYDYWQNILSSFRELYFTKEQLILFREKNYYLRVHLLIDNLGNVLCVRFGMPRVIFKYMSQKQLNDIYQAFMKVKPPMNSRWRSNTYFGGSVQLIRPNMRK